MWGCCFFNGGVSCIAGLTLGSYFHSNNISDILTSWGTKSVWEWKVCACATRFWTCISPTAQRSKAAYFLFWHSDRSPRVAPSPTRPTQKNNKTSLINPAAVQAPQSPRRAAVTARPALKQPLLHAAFFFSGLLQWRCLFNRQLRAVWQPSGWTEGLKTAADSRRHVRTETRSS